MATERVSVQLPAEHVAALRELASTSDRSLAGEVRRAVRRYLDSATRDRELERSYQELVDDGFAPPLRGRSDHSP